MLRKLFLLAIGAAILGGVVFWVVTIPSTLPASALPARQADLANGKTMFLAGGCTGCHTTPGQDDATKLGGGLGLKSPFGTFYVPNISPDEKDGIGRWSEAQFATAMLKGTSPSGEHYFPAFPYPSYAKMPIADIHDLFAYIKTLPAVSGRARAHDVPFPFNIRRSLGGWKFLFFDDKIIAPKEAQSAEWNRGHYLVNGPGHCAECHSTRNLLGGIIEGKRLAGGPAPDGQGGVPNLRQQGKLKNWSPEDFAEVLETGMTPDAGDVGGSMREVIRNMAQLSREERLAIGTYLKSLPAEGRVP